MLEITINIRKFSLQVLSELEKNVLVIKNLVFRDDLQKTNFPQYIAKIVEFFEKDHDQNWDWIERDQVEQNIAACLYDLDRYLTSEEKICFSKLKNILEDWTLKQGIFI